jgi:hypothetical protein
MKKPSTTFLRINCAVSQRQTLRSKQHKRPPGQKKIGFGLWRSRTALLHHLSMAMVSTENPVDSELKSRSSVTSPPSESANYRAQSARNTEKNWRFVGTEGRH